MNIESKNQKIKAPNNNGPIEILHVNSKKVACDGSRDGNQSSGHPLVYLNMGNEDNVTCPYCSKYFTIKKTTIRK